MNSYFQRGFEKTAKKSAPKGVSVIGVINKDGKILVGLRRDNGKWTNPGGHIEGAEKPIVAAKRELLEETGIDLPLSAFTALGSGSRVTSAEGDDLIIYPFKASYVGSVSGSKDPDEEIKQWRWCDMKNIGDEVRDNLHVPKKNILFDRLGVEYT